MFRKHDISSQVRDELICAKSDLINSAPNLALSYMYQVTVCYLGLE